MNSVRYTGSVPVMFSSPDREVLPGDVFPVADNQLSSYLRRGDIELVREPSTELEIVPPVEKTLVKEKTAD